MAILDYFVRLNDFPVLIALKFSERISVFSLIRRSFKLSVVLITLYSLGLDKLLLLQNDLFE